MSKLRLDFFSNLKRHGSKNNVNGVHGFNNNVKKGRAVLRSQSFNCTSPTKKAFDSPCSDISSPLTPLIPAINNEEEKEDGKITNRLRSLATTNDTQLRELIIQQSHWVDASKIRNCMQCNKVFAVLSKKQNCRRCGQVLCETCCQYRRRLSPNCDPDPQGNLYQVCYGCAGLNEQPLGQFRTLTQEFHEERKAKRLNMAAETKRLVNGFRANVSPSSKFKSAVNDTFQSLIKVPDWQKSSKWEISSEIESCTRCHHKLLFFVKRNCRLCGSVFCANCCQSDLLVYYTPEQQVALHLIGVVGCPDKEPDVCVYLPICKLCRVKFEEYQVQQFYELQQGKTSILSDNLSDIRVTLDNLQALEEKIDIQLPIFREKVESYAFDGVLIEEASDFENMKLFTKMHSELSDLFIQYAVVVQGLKNQKPSSLTERQIMRNISLIKCKKYNEGMYLLKTLKVNLDKTLPKEKRDEYERYTDTQAINNTYIMTRQLGFEALRLSLKHGFETTLAEEIREVDKICFEELKSFVACESWEDHLAVLNSLIKDQLESKKLVALNENEVNTYGSTYVKEFLTERCLDVVFKIHRSLESKSSEKTFLNAKKSIKALHEKLQESPKNTGDFELIALPSD